MRSWTRTSGLAAMTLALSVGASAQTAFDQLKTLGPGRGLEGAPAVPGAPVSQDPVLERLNQEIGALHAQAARSLVVVWIMNASQTSLDDFLVLGAPRRAHAQIQGLGSGFIVREDGLILTNRHVAETANPKNGDFLVVELPDHRKVPVKSVTLSEGLDAAILRVEPPSRLCPVKLGDSAGLKVGDSVFAAGSPLGMIGNFTWGTVTRFDKGLGIQSDAVINPGSSGGPLFNARGEVVGMNTAIAPGPYFSGNSFSIPINVLKLFLEGAGR